MDRMALALGKRAKLRAKMIARDPDAFDERGIAYLLGGKGEKAAECFEKADAIRAQREPLKSLLKELKLME
jgi:hypothetical protein